MGAFIAGLARHAATVLGGYLAASPDDVNQLAGALVALAGVIWSMVDKALAARAPR